MTRNTPVLKLVFWLFLIISFIGIPSWAGEGMPVNHYTLVRSSDAAWETVAEFTAPGNHSHTDKFLESGKAYTYKVLAVGNDGTVAAESQAVTV